MSGKNWELSLERNLRITNSVTQPKVSSLGVKFQTPGRRRSAAARAPDLHAAKDAVAAERTTRSAKRQKLCQSSSMPGETRALTSPNGAARVGRQGLDNRHLPDRSLLAPSLLCAYC